MSHQRLLSHTITLVTQKLRGRKRKNSETGPPRAAVRAISPFFHYFQGHLKTSRAGPDECGSVPVLSSEWPKSVRNYLRNSIFRPFPHYP